MSDRQLITILPSLVRNVTLGTSDLCDIQVEQVGPVRALHAKIAKSLLNGYAVTPLDPTGPVRIERGQRSFQIFETTVLESGDVIRLGGRVRLLWAPDIAVAPAS
jgi:hypothetical protein